MTRFQYINTNIEQIKKEIKLGLISTTVLNHYAIYSRYDYYRRLGNYVGYAVLFTSESCKVSERFVYKIIKDMESEI
ncbi:MAG: hypothetical protein MUO72_09475 [Bacteroidales bacterium]|nr:hypothetical protein [Bacteroidales bacterium]